jgi:hypothetical protein
MERTDYPGYSNIAFQRRRGFAFRGFHADLDSLERFEAKVDSLLCEEAQRHRNLIMGEGSSDPSLGQAVAELEGSFSDILISGLVVSFFGRFESFLYELCQMLREYGVSSLDIGKLRNIDDAKNYLNGVQCLIFPADSIAWARIKDLAELRHVTIHCNRILGSTDHRRREAIARIPHVNINVRNEVWLKRPLLGHIASTLRSFTGELADAFGPSGEVPS